MNTARQQNEKGEGRQGRGRAGKRKSRRKTDNRSKRKKRKAEGRIRNIVLTRIDDRLIHGQVVTAWIRRYPINRILIVDDELSKNRLMERIYRAAAPVGTEVLIKPVQEAAAFLREDGERGENILILVKVPQVIEALLEGEVEIKKVILGGMAAGKGRKTFIRNVSASREEIECMRRISERGIELSYQLVPDEKETDLKKLL